MLNWPQASEGAANHDDHAGYAAVSVYTAVGLWSASAVGCRGDLGLVKSRLSPVVGQDYIVVRIFSQLILTIGFEKLL